MDRIIIRGLRIFAYHGVNPEEKQNGQDFVIDLTATLDLSAASLSDNLDDTVSYAKIIKTVKRVFTAEKYDLIEKCAGAVAEAVLEEYPQIEEVTVKVMKPDAPISADFGPIERPGCTDLIAGIRRCLKKYIPGFGPANRDLANEMSFEVS